MANKKYSLIGVPLDCGKIANGCLMGPDAYRIQSAVRSDALARYGRHATTYLHLRRKHGLGDFKPRRFYRWIYTRPRYPRVHDQCRLL